MRAGSSENPVGSIKVAARKQTNALPPDVFVQRRLELVPALAAPRFLSAQFPAEAAIIAVEAMTFDDGRLWLNARSRGESNAMPGAGRLWFFTPDANRLEPIRGPLQANTINALFPATGRLWLALDGGIGSLDTQTFAVEAYGADRGLTSTNVVGFAEADSSLLVLGEFGGVFSLPPNAANFARIGPPALARDPRAPEPSAPHGTFPAGRRAPS